MTPGIEQKLGFDKIRQQIRSYCQGPAGEEFADKLRFSHDHRVVSTLHAQTAECLSLMRAGDAIPSGSYFEIAGYLKRAELPGSFLMEEELFQISSVLLLLQSSLRFIESRAEILPELMKVIAEVNIPGDVLKEINRCIDVSGQMKSNASPTLAKIRSDISATQGRVRRVLNSVLREAASKGYLPDDASPTIRGGRMVLPVLAEHKRHLKGFIHDESATGQTVFMEPAAVLELNNDLQDLELQERKEIIRILSKLTDLLRPYVPGLKHARKVLGILDFLRAKSMWAVATESICPQIEKKALIKWKNAVHPLLYQAHKAAGKPVIPQDIFVNPEQRILVISGPNAGGKSVTLKTIGLLQYMLQCGVPIPVSDQSICGIYHQIFLDIGDEQSIENDLSTYSSHLTAMRSFLEHADKRTLVLIDEFGTGTEPDFGGAIAEAILEGLNKRLVQGVVTTHYANLKELAGKTPGLQNAAMQFDLDNLEPLYRLQIGKPGSSFALEIAGKIGLPQVILDGARQKIGKERVRLDRALVELEREKARLEKQNRELERADAKLKKTSQEYTELKTYLETEKKAIINQAKEEAARLLADTNRQIEATIRLIKEAKGEKEPTKAIRQEFEVFKEKITPKKVKKPAFKPILSDGPISVGDMVAIEDTGATARVVAIKGKQAEVLIGDLQSKVKVERLRKVGKVQEPEKPKRQTAKVGNMNVAEAQMSFSPQLDIRGMRAEEALPALHNFLDRALLLNQLDLRIVHGKGDGVLRGIVRNELRTWPHIERFGDEHADMGGAGVTLVSIRRS